MVCMFHLAFKILALVGYIFLGLLSDDKTFCYIIVLTLCAFDFWTVKNVSGRILVGLRWWSTIDDITGKEKWFFESMGQHFEGNKVDSRVFWTGQYTNCAVWGIFAIVNLLSFSISNLMVCIIASVLTFTNTRGYMMCDKNQQQGISSYIFKKASNNLSGS